VKSNIENRRSENEFGTVIWQLGEIWPTGGWGSLEYGMIHNLFLLFLLFCLILFCFCVLFCFVVFYLSFVFFGINIM